MRDCRYIYITIPLSGGINAAGLAKFFIDKVDGARAATENSMFFIQRTAAKLFDDLKMKTFGKLCLDLLLKPVALQPKIQLLLLYSCVASMMSI